MEKLENFVMSCLRNCARDQDHKEIWFHQAFGAVQFYIIENPNEHIEVAQMWGKMKPYFERQIWGNKF